jgi:glycosyltransferase involved in cell wall biosynthesis
MLVLAASFFSNDIVLSVNNFGPLFGKKGQKRLILIHDVWFVSERYEGSRLSQIFFRTLISLQLKVTHKVITVSEFSKKELIQKFGLDAEDIDVVPNCLSKPKNPKVPVNEYRGDEISDEKEQRRYFLLVGADRKNKNVWRAIEAFVSFTEQADSSVQLIVVGLYSQSYLKKLREAFGPIMDDSINVEGYVSRERYDFLLNHAAAIVFPSLYEGYGIPVIEAITANKPVLVSSGTVCAENAGVMGIVVDGTDVASIQEGYTRLMAFDSSAYGTEVERFKRRYGDCGKAAQKLCEVIETV